MFALFLPSRKKIIIIIIVLQLKARYAEKRREAGRRREALEAELEKLHAEEAFIGDELSKTSTLKKNRK